MLKRVNSVLCPLGAEGLLGEVLFLGVSFFTLGGISPQMRRTRVFPAGKPWNGRALPGQFSQIWGPRKSGKLLWGVFRAPARPTFVTKQKWAKVGLEPAVLRTPFSPAGLRRSDSGAWGARGLPFPSRALRPAAVELSTFLSQRTAPAAVGVGGFCVSAPVTVGR